MYVPGNDTGDTAPPMLDPGQDFVLPYLSKEGEDITARGIALFHGQKFTGSLSNEQGVLYVLMTGKWKNTARFVKGYIQDLSVIAKLYYVSG